MGYEVTIKLGDAAGERVMAVTGDEARFRNVEDYVNELIQRDADDAFHADPAVIAELRRAFATPEAEYVTVTAEDVIARGRARRQA